MPADVLHDDLTIGEMATVTGLSIHTLRYYEKIGLIEPVPRLDNGHRRYSRVTAQRAESLSYLRATGLGIDDMRSYLRGLDRGDVAAGEHATMLAAHADRITAQIEQLTARHAYIESTARYWALVAAGRRDSDEAQRLAVLNHELARRLG